MDTKIKRILFGFWIVLAVLGVLGIAERLIWGHALANYGSYVVWGLWVSAYIYFIGLSAGAFLLSSLIYVFGIRELERVGKLALYVAIVTLIMALGSIWFDLGRMDRFYRVFMRPNFSSMMAWMIWLYTTYFALLLIEAWFAMRPDLARWTSKSGIKGTIGRSLAFTNKPLSVEQEDSGRRWLRILASFGIPLAIAFHGGVGSLFATVNAREYWHSPLLPVLFLTGALVSGGGLMAFIIALVWKKRNEEFRNAISFIGKAVLGLLLLDIMLEWAEFSIPMWYGMGHEYALLKNVLFGQYWWVFWVVHVLLGTLIPLWLLIKKRDNPNAIGLAGLLVAVTFLAVRLNIVIPDLVTPNLKLLENSFTDPRLTFAYVPSFFEWQVTFFIIAAGIAAFYLGLRYLPLIDERRVS